MLETPTLEFWLLGLIPLLPALGALLNGVLGARLPRKVVATVACSAVGASFGIALGAFRAMVQGGQEGADGHTIYPAFFYEAFTWFSAGDLTVDVALRMDTLSAALTLVVTGVGFLIHIYSVGYMEHDRGFARYFTYLNLFVFAMLMLVLGDNLLILFLGWEGVGLASYLLIGFWYQEEANAIAGKKAFIVNRVGDFAVLLGMFLLFQLAGTLDFGELEIWAAGVSEQQLAVLGPILTTALIFLFIGCTGKSAQIPLYVWLPDAMAGPTPVSALIHAATMVTAGVYLVTRLSFLFALSPVAMTIIAVVGALTAFFAATIGLVQNDIKKVLAYSTVSQLGYMFLACGMGAFFAGIFHLITHAFFKALLFLGSGSVIHAMSEEQDIRKMGGLKKWMPITRWTFLIACLAIAGIPPLSGFFSKDEILWFTLTNHHVLGGVSLNWILWGLATITAGLTAFYMFRLYFLTFEGECRADDETKAHLHESPFTMTAPLVVLAILSVVGGFIGIPHIFHLPNLLHDWLYQVVVYGEGHFTASLGDGMAWFSMLVAMGAAAIGIGAAWTMYGKPSELPRRIAEQLSRVHRVLLDKYYVDELYQATIGRGVRVFGLVCHRLIDQVVIDLIMVNGSAWLARFAAVIVRPFQNGDVQRYAAMFVVALAFIFFVFIL